MPSYLASRSCFPFSLSQLSLFLSLFPSRQLYTLENGGEAEILLLHKQLSETMEELASLDVAFTPQENDFLAFDEGDLPKMRAKVSKAGCVVSNSCVAHETVATGEGEGRVYGRVCCWLGNAD